MNFHPTENAAADNDDGKGSFKYNAKQQQTNGLVSDVRVVVRLNACIAFK